MRKITDYDKVKIIGKNESLKQKCFYKIEEKGKKHIVSLIEGLSLMDFSEKLYDGVIQGSKRWWVLERRKFDYFKYKSKNNHKIFSIKEIRLNEAEWEKKVDDFYSLIENGYIESTSVGNDEKVRSQYILNKYYNNEDVLPFDEVRCIGLDENKEPLFYKIILDENDESVDIKCKVTSDDIKSDLNCKKFTQKWWVLQRMRFDYGNELQPLLKGQEKGDWRGIEYKFKCYYKDSAFELVDRQEKAWNRYIDSLINYLNEEHTELSYEEKFKSNSRMLSKMEGEKFYRLIIDNPIFLIHYSPKYLYSPILLYIINKLHKDNKIKSKYGTKCDDVIKSLKTMISNFIYKDKDDDLYCERITLDVLKSIVHNNLNVISDIFKYIIYDSIDLNMVRKTYVKALCINLDRIKIEKYIDFGSNLSLKEQIKWFSLDVPLPDFEKYDKQWEQFCADNGLYNV